MDGWDAERGLRLVVEGAPLAILFVDGRGRVFLANPAAEALFGCARGELVGNPIEAWLPEPSATATARERLGRRKDGTEISLGIRVERFETPGAEFTAMYLTDLTGRKRAEDSFRLVVEAAPNAMLMVDGNRTITLVNRITEELFGYSRGELVGKPLETLVADRARQRHLAHVGRFLADPRARAMGGGSTLVGRRKDGAEIALEIGLNPIETPDGMQTLAAIIDVTDRQRLEDELRRSNADLEQFAQLASHDLQEPLRVIGSFTELLVTRYRGKLDEKADKYLFYVADGARRLQRLVGDLLTYARAGSQGKPLAPVSSQAVVDRVLGLLADAMGAAGASAAASGLPTVLGDEGELHRLFQNLLENAIKFHGPEPLRILIEAVRQDDRWLFSVKDNGIGIDMQFADHIFEMFGRLHERSKVEGSGMGLAIAKRIVERHGGRIWVESAGDGGATFFFSLLSVPAGAS